MSGSLDTTASYQIWPRPAVSLTKNGLELKRSIALDDLTLEHALLRLGICGARRGQKGKDGRKQNGEARAGREVHATEFLQVPLGVKKQSEALDLRSEKLIVAKFGSRETIAAFVESKLSEVCFYCT